MGASYSTPDKINSDWTVIVKMKKEDVSLEYQLSSHSQVAKKTVIDVTGVPIKFNTDLITGDLTHNGLKCGTDGDVEGLKHAVNGMLNQVEDLVVGEPKPIADKEELNHIE